MAARKLELADGPTMKLKRFFGLQPGETLTEFATELKALTTADRAELISLINAEIATGAI